MNFLYPVVVVVQHIVAGEGVLEPPRVDPERDTPEVGVVVRPLEERQTLVEEALGRGAGPVAHDDPRG